MIYSGLVSNTFCKLPPQAIVRLAQEGNTCRPPGRGRDHFAEREFVGNESPDAFLEDAATLNRWLNGL